MSKLGRSAISCVVALCLVPSAWATEGGLGRSISGTGVQESAGLVPPAPVWVAALGTLYQNASIGASREVPIAGQLSLGLHSDLSLTTATMAKVWDTGPGRWNFESSFTLPYDWNEITAEFGTPQNRVSERQSASALFDVFFTPITAGYHFSDTEHIAFSLGIWTDSGDYTSGRLANPSLNNWTFVPTMAFTKVIPEHGIEIDTSLGFQFYTRNSASDYQNAPVMTLDVMLLQKFAGGFALGIISGWIQQLGADSGPTADRLNGFEGQDISVGPYLSYATKLGGMAPLSFSLRWVPTVESKNRISGSAVMGTVALVF